MTTARLLRSSSEKLERILEYPEAPGLTLAESLALIWRHVSIEQRGAILRVLDLIEDETDRRMAVEAAYGDCAREGEAFAEYEASLAGIRRKQKPETARALLATGPPPEISLTVLKGGGA